MEKNHIIFYAKHLAIKSKGDHSLLNLKLMSSAVGDDKEIKNNFLLMNIILFRRITVIVVALYFCPRQSACPWLLNIDHLRNTDEDVLSE